MSQEDRNLLFLTFEFKYKGFNFQSVIKHFENTVYIVGHISGGALCCEWWLAHIPIGYRRKTEMPIETTACQCD